MRAVVQRVLNAFVSVDKNTVGSCKKGFLILICAENGDTEFDAEILAAKISKLRVFSDSNGKMNLSITDVGGEVLSISQFTLCADVKKGNRPSFANAMEPVGAEMLYELFCKKLSDNGIKSVQKGIFGADMKVSLLNDGPVTVILDTKIWRKYED